MESFLAKAAKVDRILARISPINDRFRIGEGEYRERCENILSGLDEMGIDCGFVYSDHRNRDEFSYLCGPSEVTIEPMAGFLGSEGFHLMAGPLGARAAEEIAGRMGAMAHRVDLLRLPEGSYDLSMEPMRDVLVRANGCAPLTLGLLTDPDRIPHCVYQQLCDMIGEENLFDCHALIGKAQSLKSDREIERTRQASHIADAMMEGMLAVLEPGMLETQVAQWGSLIAEELGADGLGQEIVVSAGKSNRAIYAKARNRVIQEGDFVSLRVAPQVGGLTACERGTVIATLDPSRITRDQRYWVDFVEGAFLVAFEAYKRVSWENLPARLQEHALRSYFKNRANEVSIRLGKPVDLIHQKPFSGVRSGGYVYEHPLRGAITLDSDEALGLQIVSYLDVGVLGAGEHLNEVVLPGVDYIGVERTLAKIGAEVEILSRLPINLQAFVGGAAE